MRPTSAATSTASRATAANAPFGAGPGRLDDHQDRVARLRDGGRLRGQPQVHVHAGHRREERHVLPAARLGRSREAAGPRRWRLLAVGLRHENYFFMIMDNPTDDDVARRARTRNCGTDVMCLDSLLEIGDDEPGSDALAAKKGWYLPLNDARAGRDVGHHRVRHDDLQHAHAGGAGRRAVHVEPRHRARLQRPLPERRAARRRRPLGRDLGRRPAAVAGRGPGDARRRQDRIRSSSVAIRTRRSRASCRTARRPARSRRA